MPSGDPQRGKEIEMPTKEPVTVEGWYENTDGTVSRYYWNSGRLREAESVASWEHVPTPEQAQAKRLRDQEDYARRR